MPRPMASRRALVREVMLVGTRPRNEVRAGSRNGCAGRVPASDAAVFDDRARRGQDGGWTALKGIRQLKTIPSSRCPPPMLVRARAPDLRTRRVAEDCRVRGAGGSPREAAKLSGGSQLRTWLVSILKNRPSTRSALTNARASRSRAWTIIPPARRRHTDPSVAAVRSGR